MPQSPNILATFSDTAAVIPEGTAAADAADVASEPADAVINNAEQEFSDESEGPEV